MAKLIERLIDTDVKAQLLMLFRGSPNLTATIEDLAVRIDREPLQIRKDVGDFVRMGLLKENRYYQLDTEKDLEIQEAISARLAQEAGREETEVSEYKLSTGVAFLDKLLSGGIPPSSTVLLLGDPGSGRELLIYQMIVEMLGNGRVVTFVAFDDFPNRIREAITNLAVHRESLGLDRLLFIDYYSKLVGSESSEKYSGDPSNLMEQTILITKLIPDEEGLLVLDSATTLFQSVGVKSSMEFLRRIIARVRKSKVNCLINMTRGAFHPAIVAATMDLVDGVIEMKVEEDAGVPGTQLRISKMKRARYEASWIPYGFTPECGLQTKEG